MKNLYKDVGEWAEKIFGKDRKTISILLHMEEELDELSIEVENFRKGWGDRQAVLNEMADLQILLFNLMQKIGVDYDTYKDALYIKHIVNTERRWVEVDGKMKHLPDEFKIEEPNNDTVGNKTTKGLLQQLKDSPKYPAK